MSFWGLILKSNKKYTQTLEKPFHLSAAALDHSSSDNEPVQVMYTHEENSYLLCTLQKGKVYQCQLDLNFLEGDKLCFSTKGSGIVHLSGYLHPEQDDFGDFDMDGEDDSEEEDEEIDDLKDLRQKLAQKKAAGAGKPDKKKAAQAAAEESDDDDDEQDDDDSDDDELAPSAEQDSDDDDDDDDEEEEDDDEDDDEEEEAEAQPPKKQAKLDNQAQNGKKQKQNGLENGDASKKQQKDGKQQQQKEVKQETGKQQKLQGGLIIQDLKQGNGAEAKPGKKLQVYYEGRLKSNNKIFDATKNGPGFKFALGRGEVIKAWDVGMNGMKVGGKRRLICPPGLAYGAKGSPPVIPQNATLVFEVELKGVS